MHTAPAFSMNAEFAPILQRQMNAFNNDPPGDSLQVTATTAHVSARCACACVLNLLTLHMMNAWYY